jgi:predicted Zn-dependent protease with MMP-like domain/Flp pilus assembly protein TadD
MSPQLRVALVLTLAAAACTRSAAPEAPERAVPPAAVRTAAGKSAALDRIVPPRPEPCAAGRREVPEALAERAAAELDAGAHARALGCAEEALRAEPRLVPALAVRAESLAGLGRIEEARLAYARALAVDPDDAETLLGAAELHVRRLGGDRDALETALAYATRGARAATRRGDPELAARLEVVAGMAENDLGRSHLALVHLDRAVRARPDDPDATYERGLALYELCRFADAQRAFERTLVLAPEDPWATHQLGLVLERRGDPRAAALLERAHALAPAEFRGELPLDPGAFRAEVAEAEAALPEAERAAIASVPVEIQDLPDLSDLLATEPPLSPSILGLFRGPSETEPCLPADGAGCRAIVLYRKNLARFARSGAELKDQIRITLLHEIGHLHGLDEEQLRERGLE